MAPYKLQVLYEIIDIPLFFSSRSYDQIQKSKHSIRDLRPCRAHTHIQLCYSASLMDRKHIRIGYTLYLAGHRLPPSISDSQRCVGTWQWTEGNDDRPVWSISPWWIMPSADFWPRAHSRLQWSETWERRFHTRFMDNKLTRLMRTYKWAHPCTVISTDGDSLVLGKVVRLGGTGERRRHVRSRCSSAPIHTDWDLHGLGSNHL